MIPLLSLGSPKAKVWDSKDCYAIRRKLKKISTSMTEDVLSSMDKFLALFSDQQHFDLFDTETESFADPTTLQGKELLKEYERDSYLNQKNDDFEAHNNIAGLAELYTDNDPFFDFHIKTGDDGSITGIAWMTGAMRDAFERYGTAVFTDMMKSAFNTSLFPYAAICVKRSTNKLDVATEGLLIEELNMTYLFLFDSMFEMGTGRTRAQVLVVGADGFISQRFITETLELPNARYMADSWHLLNKNLADKDNFTRVNYNAIITNLKGMIDAESEHFFETHYTSAMNILIEKRASTKERNYLEAFEKKKDEYALYLIKKMPGSFLYHGSQASESNHSVIHAHLGRYYCEEAYRLMADLINIGMSRQSTKRKELLQQNNLLRCQKELLQKRKDSYHGALLKAVDMIEDKSLNYKGFLLYEKEFIAIQRYKKEIHPVTGVCIVITPGTGTRRVFQTIFSKCPGCTIKDAFQAECRHEILNKVGRVEEEEFFCINNFDRRWHYIPRIKVLPRNTRLEGSLAAEKVGNSSNISGVDGIDSISEHSQEISIARGRQSNTFAHISSRSADFVETNLHGNNDVDYAIPDLEGPPSDVMYNVIKSCTDNLAGYISTLKDTLMKNQCLGMVSGMMDIIRKGYASDSLINLWRERHSLITASVPRNGEKSRPKDPEKALFSYANTQRAMKRPKSNLERIQNNSRQKIQSKGIRRCTFCNKEKCTVVNCPLKMSHGQVVVDISKFKMDIERSYPIAIHPFDSSMTALVRSTDISLTKGSNHIIVHSIHPMNVNSASINGIEQLVIKVSFVGSRKTEHPGQIIPQLGRVGIECHALFSFMDMIAGSANRFVFNAIENDGKGSDFIVRGPDYNVNRVHNGNFLHPNSQLISRHTEGQYVPQQYMSMGLNPYGFQGNHAF